MSLKGKSINTLYLTITSAPIKQLKDNTSDLKESLTVNQDLVGEKLNTLKSQLRVAQDEIIENKIELKEQLRIREDIQGETT